MLTTQLEHQSTSKLIKTVDDKVAISLIPSVMNQLGQALEDAALEYEAETLQRISRLGELLR